MGGGVDDADDRVHFRYLLRLDKVFIGAVQGFWRRLFDVDRLRLRIRELDLDDGGDLGNWDFRRRDERKRIAAVRKRRRLRALARVVRHVL